MLVCSRCATKNGDWAVVCKSCRGELTPANYAPDDASARLEAKERRDAQEATRKAKEAKVARHAGAHEPGACSVCGAQADRSGSWRRWFSLAFQCPSCEVWYCRSCRFEPASGSMLSRMRRGRTDFECVHCGHKWSAEHQSAMP